MAGRFKRKITFQHTLTNSVEKKHRMNLSTNQQFDERTHAQSAIFNTPVLANTKGRMDNISDQSKHTLPGPSQGRYGNLVDGVIGVNCLMKDEDF